MSLVDNSGGVCGCGCVFGGCAMGHVVEEGMAETARFVVVQSFHDRIPIFSVFKKSLRIIMTLSLLFAVMSVYS